MLYSKLVLFLSFFFVYFWYFLFDISYAVDNWAHCSNKKYRQTFAEDDVHRL